jgi:hypothetical protein
MAKRTAEEKKNTSTKEEHSIPQKPEVTQLPDDRIQGNGKNRRSVEGPEDYVSHDTDDLK